MLNLETLGSSSKGNCYIIRTSKNALILECGLPYKKIAKALDFDFSNVSGCLISHEHKDHSKAAKDLCDHGIDVYCSTGTVMAMKLHHPRITILEKEIQFRIGSFIVLPFAAEHDAVEPLGFLIYHAEFGKLLFITDSYTCRYRFKDLNYIMIEANYSKEILQRNINNGLIPKILKQRILTSHFSIDNVKLFLSKLNLETVQEIMLIHLSDGNSDAKLFIEEIRSLTGKPTRIL